MEDTKFSHLLIYTCLWCLVGIQQLHAQIIINEICPDNTTVLADGNGNYSDYLELYNSGNESINLEGYQISDDVDELNKWVFPNILLAPDDYLILIADGESFESDYFHIPFRLSKSGESLYLSDAVQNVVETIEYPAIPENLTYSRLSDSEWQITLPSPGAVNENPTIDQLTPPVFSIEAGIFSATFELDISGNPNDEILFTTDGSVPKNDDQIFQNSLSVDTSQCICAKRTNPDFIDSEVVCHTYIIGQHSLPVLSICADPEDLFDSQDGIFELGPDAETDWPFWGANFWSDKEVDVHMEYFETNKRVFYGNYGLQMHGGRESRTAPQKTFRLLAKSKYDTEYFEYPFFTDKPNMTRVKRLVLRNASGDYNEGHMRDGFAQSHLIDNGLLVDANAYEPIVVYINGAYYGLMGLREKIDKHYVESNFNVDDDEIDLLEQDTLLIDGTIDQFVRDFEFAVENDLSIPQNYEAISQKFDIKNIVDYFIVQTGLNSTAWPGNNIKYWREAVDDGQWKYLLFDMDVCLGRHPWTDFDIDAFGLVFSNEDNIHVKIFNALLQNENFKNYFLNRHQDIFNTILKADHFESALDELINRLRPEMSQHFSRWPDRDFETWEDVRIEKIREYIMNRPKMARQFLSSYFSLDEYYELQIIDSEHGNIKLNSLDTLDQAFIGHYFCDIPIDLTARADDGYYFSHWEIESEGVLKLLNNVTLSMKFCGPTIVKPIYQSITDDESIKVTFDMESELLSIRLLEAHSRNLILKIHNTNGQLVRSAELSNEAQYLEYAFRSGSSGVYIVSVLDGSTVLTSKRIIKVK